MGKPELPASTVNRSTVGLWGVVAIRSRPTVPPPAPLAWSAAAPCEAGTAGPAAHRVVPGSQPTQCNTLGLARGSGPFEPPTGESSPLAPPSLPAAPFSLSHDRALDGARSDSDGSDAAFRGSSRPQRRGAPPSERKALGWLKSRATHLRHRGFKGGALVRLHRLDPRRRKSLIISRPLEASVSYSTWSIFSTATLRPHGVRPSPNRHRRWSDAGKPLLAGPFPWLGWPKHQEYPGRGREVAGLKPPQILEQSGLLGGVCPRADGGLGPSNGTGFRWTPGSMLAKMARSGTSSRYRNRFGQWEHSPLSTTSIG